MPNSNTNVILDKKKGISLFRVSQKQNQSNRNEAKLIWDVGT